MKVLAILDYRGWAFDHIVKNIKRFNQDDSVDIDILYLNENAIATAQRTWKEYDVIFIIEWYLYKHFDFIPQDKVITGIHSFRKWDGHLSNGRKVLPPPQAFVNYLRKFKRINVVSKRLFELFQPQDIPHVYYTPNGVDCDVFFPQKLPDEFMIGIVAKKYFKDPKNIAKLFLPAVKKSQVDYKIMLGGTPHDEMPYFYNLLSCYVCASKDEGFSMSCLEAAACGRPVVSTDVSGTEELIIHGKTGFIVDTSIDSISSAIDSLKNDVEKCKDMGDHMREHIIDKYAWSKVVHLWTSFIKGKDGI